MLGLEEIHPPTSSSKNLPEWYKKTESYIGNQRKPDGDGATSATIKKCIPIFDAITAGYLIYNQVDVYVSSRNGEPWFEWPSMKPIEFHPIIQAPKHPQFNGFPYPKWMNNWAVKTASGYSCLFTQPIHRDLPFTIFDGIVDCDTYSAPVNFPFVLNDPKWEGMIEAGTPIAQVIPFKRDEFEMSIGSKDDMIAAEFISKKMRTKFFDSYKNQFWHKKDFK